MNTESDARITDLEAQYANGDEAFRTIFWSVLLNTIASRQEEVLHRLKFFGDIDNDYPQLSQEVGDLWRHVNYKLEYLSEYHPGQALEFGRHLLLLPDHDDPEIDTCYRYLRGNAVYLLAQEGIVSDIADLIDTGDEELAGAVERLIDLDGVAEWDKNKAFSTPEFFSLVAALQLAGKLGHLSVSQETRSFSLYEKARAKYRTPGMQDSVDYYLKLDDARDLAINVKKLLRRKIKR